MAAATFATSLKARRAGKSPDEACNFLFFEEQIGVAELTQVQSGQAFTLCMSALRALTPEGDEEQAFAVGLRGLQDTLRYKACKAEADE